MTIVIPMAGRGSRFFKEGYKLPKYMIEVKGKTLFEYSLDGLPLQHADKIIFICLKEHEEFGVSEFIKSKISHQNVEIITLDSVTRGQAETVYYARDHVDESKDILIYNIDTYFSSKTLKSVLKNTDEKADGIVGAFIDETDNANWSFAKINENGYVTETTEKIKISNLALSGLYHFSVARDFFEIAKKCISNDQTVMGEFYIAPMYNELIRNGKKIKINIVDDFIPLGTPEEVRDFELRH